MIQTHSLSSHFLLKLSRIYSLKSVQSPPESQLNKPRKFDYKLRILPLYISLRAPLYFLCVSHGMVKKLNCPSCYYSLLLSSPCYCQSFVVIVSLIIDTHLSLLSPLFIVMLSMNLRKKVSKLHNSEVNWLPNVQFESHFLYKKTYELCNFKRNFRITQFRSLKMTFSLYNPEDTPILHNLKVFFLW